MPDSLPDHIVKFVGISILKTFDTLVEIFADNTPVLNEKEIPFCKDLKDNYKTILREYEDAIQRKLHNVKDFYKTDYDLNHDENWKAVPIILFGFLFKENALIYPETFKIISSLPGCRGAMFSVLAPGKHIPAHKGIYKGVYRCLLTLKVAEDGICWIRVGDKRIAFKDGESIVFDETFEHEVMNSTTQPRLVLYLDLYRKLPFPLNLLNNALFFLLQRSSFVLTIIREYQKLENVSTEEFKPVTTGYL